MRAALLDNGIQLSPEACAAAAADSGCHMTITPTFNPPTALTDVPPARPAPHHMTDVPPACPAPHQVTDVPSACPAPHQVTDVPPACPAPHHMTDVLAVVRQSIAGPGEAGGGPQLGHCSALIKVLRAEQGCKGAAERSAARGARELLRNLVSRGTLQPAALDVLMLESLQWGAGPEDIDTALFMAEGVAAKGGALQPSSLDRLLQAAVAAGAEGEEGGTLRTHDSAKRQPATAVHVPATAEDMPAAATDRPATAVDKPATAMRGRVAALLNQVASGRHAGVVAELSGEGQSVVTRWWAEAGEVERLLSAVQCIGNAAGGVVGSPVRAFNIWLRAHSHLPLPQPAPSAAAPAGVPAAILVATPPTRPSSASRKPKPCLSSWPQFYSPQQQQQLLDLALAAGPSHAHQLHLMLRGWLELNPADGHHRSGSGSSNGCSSRSSSLGLQPHLPLLHVSEHVTALLRHAAACMDTRSTSPLDAGGSGSSTSIGARSPTTTTTTTTAAAASSLLRHPAVAATRQEVLPHPAVAATRQEVLECVRDLVQCCGSSLPEQEWRALLRVMLQPHEGGSGRGRGSLLQPQDWRGGGGGAPSLQPPDGGSSLLALDAAEGGGLLQLILHGVLQQGGEQAAASCYSQAVQALHRQVGVDAAAKVGAELGVSWAPISTRWGLPGKC